MKIIYILIFQFWLLIFNSAFSSQYCNPNMSLLTPDNVFNDNGNGTITDIRTGLMWKKCLEGEYGLSCSSGAAILGMTRQQALKYADDTAFAGYSDWRLPNIKELMSITEYACVNPAQNYHIFPNKLTTYWGVFTWTSSRNSLYLSNGRGGAGGTYNQTGAIRLVRDIATF